MSPDRERTIPRREFMRTAVAIGGASALAACVARRDGESTATPEEPAYPRGPTDLSTLPEQQHAWGKFLVTDNSGSVVFPNHQVFLFLDYVRDGPPTDEDRTAVRKALETLDRAYKRGTGGEGSAILNDGLLYSLSYSPSYFDRFDESLPDSASVQRPSETVAELGDDSVTADTYDALLHFGSDYAEIVLAVEEALFGGLETINGIEVSGTFEGVFERAERRPGFVGRGLPHEELDNEDIPEASPISMGFKSAFEDTLPREEKVTITEGPFENGTVQHASRLEIDLDEWYDQSHGDRVEKMFSPSHDSEQVGEVGDSLPYGESGVTEEIAEETGHDAESHGRVGHGQKLARVRDDDFDPIILRRGDFNGTLTDGAALNFGSIQPRMSDFVETRKAMDRIDLEGDTEPDIDTSDHGILKYIQVTNRANFLMPPRSLRALPSPRPD